MALSSFASVSFSITADGSLFYRALSMCEQHADRTTGVIQNNLEKVNQSVGRFGGKCYDTFNSVANALENAFSIAKNTLSGLFNSFADYGDTIAKMSQRTGITAQSLSEFDYIAGQCGTNLETFETAIKTMEKTLANAANGSAEAQNKLSRLGVAMYELKGKTPDEQFRRIAQAIAALPDPSQRAAAAMAMFGRSGTDLLPLMNAGAGAIDELAQKAHELGLVLSDEDYKAAEAANDAMDNLKRSFDGLKMQLSSALAPILSNVANIIANATSKIIQWSQENPILARTLAAIATAIATLVTGLYAAAAAAQVLNAAMFMLESHPILLAISAIAAALAALVIWYQKATKSAEGLYEAQQRITNENKTKRQTLQGQFDRLKALNSKDKLTDSEEVEREYLIGEINGAYKDLGLTIDKTTGKIANMDEAERRFTIRQRVGRHSDVQNEKWAIEKRRDELIEKQGKKDEGSPEWLQLQHEIDGLNDEIASKERLLEAIWKGMEEPEGSISFEPEKETEEGPTSAQKDAAKMAEDIVHANDTKAEQEVRRLEDRFENIIKNRAAELKEQEGLSDEEAEQQARAENAELNEALTAQIKDIRDKAAAEEEKRTEEEKKRTEEEKKRAEEAEKAEKERTEAEKKRKEEERAGYEVSETDKKRAEFNERQAGLTAQLYDAIDKGKTREINSTIKELNKLEKDREAFEKQAAVDRAKAAAEDYKAKKAALDEAKKSGNQEEIDQAAKEFKEATDELADAQRGAASYVSDQQQAIKEADEARRRQIEAATDEAEENAEYAQATAAAYESKGTFNAMEAAALGQANDYDRKIYENGEEQVRYLRYLYELQNKQQQSPAVFA